MNSLKKILVSVCVLVLMAGAVSGQEIKEVLFASDPWPPFAIGEENEPVKGGLSIQLCEMIFSQLGIGVSSRLYPWKRVLMYLKNGQADVTFPLIKNAQRDRYIVFTDVIMTDNGQVWYLSDREGGPIEWDIVEDLSPYTIGIVSGYSHGCEFDEAFKKKVLKIEPSNSYEQGIRKLLAHRMDILLGNVSVISDLIRNHPEWQGKITHTSKPYNQNIYRIGISRKSPAASLIPAINKVVQEMKSNGSMDRILLR